METRRLEYFVVLASERSFSRASEVLGISQPALSQQIARLERALDTTLFDRTRQPVELTPAGQALLARCRRIVDLVDGLPDISARAKTGEVGIVRVGMVNSLLFSPWVNQRVRAFAQKHPDVRIDVSHDSTEAIEQDLLGGRIDVAISYTRLGPEWLNVAHLYDDPVTLVLPIDHPHAHSAGPVPLHELKDETFVVFPREVQSTLYDELVRNCLVAGFSPKLRTSRSSFLDQVGLVGHGMGVAIVPHSVTTVTIPTVSYQELDPSAFTTGVYAGWRPSRANPSKALFLDVLLERADDD